MRHRHIILAIRAEQAVSGLEWVETTAVSRRTLDAFGDLSNTEDESLSEGVTSEKRTRLVLEMIRDLALDGTFLELRSHGDDPQLQCRLTTNGLNMAADLMQV